MSSKTIEIANSPTGQALYRYFMGIATTVGVSGIMFLLSDGAKTRDMLYNYQFSNNERIAKLEGRVVEIKGSVDAHRRRLDSSDADIRTVWTKIFDMLGNGASNNNRRTP